MPSPRPKNIAEPNVFDRRSVGHQSYNDVTLIQEWLMHDNSALLAVYKRPTDAYAYNLQTYICDCAELANWLYTNEPFLLGIFTTWRMESNLNIANGTHHCSQAYTLLLERLGQLADKWQLEERQEPVTITASPRIRKLIRNTECTASG
jgi:hypothetical protein